MKKTFCILMTAFLYTLSAWSIDLIPMPKTPRVPQFENELLKVWKTVILPEQPLQMHRHDRSRIVVGLKGGTLKKIQEDGRVFDLIFETGRAYFLEADPAGELHGDINESDEPIEVMVVEFK